MSAFPKDIEIVVRPRTKAVEDGTLRYRIPSSNNKDQYFVELDAYNGTGRCSCLHFSCRLEPIIRKGISPREAIEKRLVKLKQNWQMEDALRCRHIISCRSQFLDDVLEAIAEKQRAQRKPAYAHSS